MKYFTFTYLLVVCLISWSGQAYSQVDTTRIDTVRASGQPESVEFKVVPWEFRPTLNMNQAASDSSLRWQIWPDWTYKKNRDPGVISYRLGTSLRSNALVVDTHDPRYQELRWEGRSMNDPVSGTVQWHLMPHHKISRLYEDNGGISHQTEFYLKEYYLNKPLTRLLYDESKFNFQNLDFLISQNFSQKLNAELMYLDRKSGGEYPNSEIEGRQIFGRLYYLPDHRQMWKLQFLNNHYDEQQPFGYTNTESFNRFDAVANEGSGNTDLAASTLALNYYLRDAGSTSVRNHFQASLYLDSRIRNTSYFADTTRYKVLSAGTSIRKWWNVSGISLEGGGTAETYYNTDHTTSSLDLKSWQHMKVHGKVRLDPFSFLQLNGSAEYHIRSDGHSGSEFRVGSKLYFGEKLSLSGDASYGTIMPTPQQLYWQSVEYKGNRSLSSESIMAAASDLQFRAFDKLQIGVKGGIKHIDGPVFMSSDSVFNQGGVYNSYSAAAYFDFDHPNLELSGSASVHRYENQVIDLNVYNSLPEYQRIWLKGSAYWKGYLFDRATFVKAGLSGMFSPGQYRAGRYYPALDFWQPGFEEPVITSFSRVDVDISARIRSIMIVMRWENVLDDVAQLGYFETAGYPMSQRRFIFGIRALFRN